MVGQRKADAGGVAILVGMDVDADFVIGDVAQEIGENLMGHDVEALPTGGVVAGGLSADTRADRRN